ncbi:hypothetical protein GCM10025859_32460 [Alicyclobacillus fastidiosus]|nr:hypothetical protein GCM10025859_32460 [Alicyclobacillus fastidiosus]
MVPKVLQVLTEDPEIYRVADKFVEAGDWITLCLTGRLVRNAGGAGFKALWHARDGYPPTGYFRALHPELEDLVDKKLAGRVVPVGSNVGGLSEEMASSLGLLPGTPVASAVIDAFAAVPGLGIAQPGKMVLAMGTSTCHMLLADREEFVPGMTGVVQNGIIPGYYGYEAGQAAVGDIFGWFAQHGVPPYVLDSARREGISTFDWLERRADSLVPGESGLLALDWWNGNRILADTTLSGVIIGYTLATKPEEIYRALLESTAFGTRMIIEQFEEKGLEVNTLHVGGGIAQKNRLLMQIYADVTGKRVYVPKMNENVALGSALFGAVAAGHGAGGTIPFRRPSSR